MIFPVLFIFLSTELILLYLARFLLYNPASISIFAAAFLIESSGTMHRAQDFFIRCKEILSASPLPPPSLPSFSLVFALTFYLYYFPTLPSPSSSSSPRASSYQPPSPLSSRFVLSSIFISRSLEIFTASSPRIHTRDYTRAPATPPDFRLLASRAMRAPIQCRIKRRDL